MVFEAPPPVPAVSRGPAHHLGATYIIAQGGCSRLTYGLLLSSWATLSLPRPKPVLSVGRKLPSFFFTLWPVI